MIISDISSIYLIISNVHPTCSCRLLFHLLENTSLLKSMGFTVVPWEVLTRYQTTVISWTKRILELPPVNVSADTYQMKPAKRGVHMILFSKCQELNLKRILVVQDE